MRRFFTAMSAVVLVATACSSGAQPAPTTAPAPPAAAKPTTAPAASPAAGASPSAAASPSALAAGSPVAKPSAIAAASPLPSPSAGVSASPSPVAAGPVLPSPTSPQTSGGKKIALLLPESKTARYETQDRPLFTAKVMQICSDCQLLYSNANQDAAQQQSQAEAALTNGANVLVLDAVDWRRGGSHRRPRPSRPTCR